MHDFTAERLNFEVVLYKGCTLNEIIKIGGVSVISCLMIFVFITISIFGSILWGFIPSLLVSPLIGLVLISRLQMLKRDKPYGYYEQLIQIKFSKFGIKNPYISRNGFWSVERLL